MSKKGEAEGEAEYHYVSPGECPSVLEMLNSDKHLLNRMLLCIEIFHTNCMLAFIVGISTFSAFAYRGGFGRGIAHHVVICLFARATQRPSATWYTVGHKNHTGEQERTSIAPK